MISQLGRPDDGTDVSGFYNIELFAPLRPFEEWPKGLTKDKLTDELSKELGESFPGVVFNFSQMISDNVEEALSGVKGANSIKLFGSDLNNGTWIYKFGSSQEFVMRRETHRSRNRLKMHGLPPMLMVLKPFTIEDAPCTSKTSSSTRSKSRTIGRIPAPSKVISL